MSKKVLISGYYGFENLGDELILSVLLRHLQGWGYEPVVLSENPHQTQAHFQVEALGRLDVHHIWDILGRAEFFLSGGGGLFQDVTGPMSPIYYGGLIEMAAMKQCPVAFVAQGIGPLKTPIGKFFTGRALNRCQYVSVRDVKSQAMVSQLSRKSAQLVGDPAWLWQPTEHDVQTHGFGVSLRPWKKLTPEAIDYLAILIAQYPVARDSGVNLIDCQAGADIIPLSRLEQKLKAEGIQCRWFTGSKAITGIQQSQVLLAMRFHAVLLAALMGVPTMTISYDPKVESLAAQLKQKYVSVKEVHTLSPMALDDAFLYPDGDAIHTFRYDSEKGFSALENWASTLIRLQI